MIGTSEGCSKGIAPGESRQPARKKGLPCQGRGIPRSRWVETPMLFCPAWESRALAWGLVLGESQTRPVGSLGVAI